MPISLSRLAAALVAAAALGAGAASADTVADIRARGQLLCGVGAGSPGFSVEERGAWRGLDADYCRAVAAVVLGDATKVRIVPVSAARRFEVLTNGEVDMLARSTTWSLEREAGQRIAFAGINYYDGQAFMVRRDSGIGSARQIEGKTVCVAAATSSEQNLAEYGRAMRLHFTTLALPYTEAVAAFFDQRCDMLTSDASALAALRIGQGPRADRFTLLPEIISKEPLGPLVRKDDWRFFDIVRWTHFALLNAEELDITSTTIEGMRNSANPDIQRFFGRLGQSGTLLGLENDWAAQLVRQVGSYREVWERNIAPLGLLRGPNLLWIQGGLQYAPPMR